MSPSSAYYLVGVFLSRTRSRMDRKSGKGMIFLTQLIFVVIAFDGVCSAISNTGISAESESFFRLPLHGKYIVQSSSILIFCPSNCAELPIGQECVTSAEQTGYCVNIKECKPLLKAMSTLNRSRRRLILQNKRICASLSDDIINQDIEVCCKRRELNAAFMNIAIAKLPSACGSSLEHRVAGGNLTKEGEFQWTALLTYRTSKYQSCEN